MPDTPAATYLPLFKLLHAAGLPLFVETATGVGDVAHAAGDAFDTVITMEADPALYEAAHARLSGRKGILPLRGDGLAMLGDLLPRLAAPAVFWLSVPPAPGEGLPGGLAAILADPRGHVLCLPGRSAPDAALAPDRDAVVRDGVLLLVPRDNAALRRALSLPA